ncbi:hypothetical protein SAMN06296241_2653 [Salinimicrobium sediminis]|uniref:Uncharacterized protein n=1 Tax=Salinimicrobium sediminis TaxID=1343891 RepID=A0A285X6W7_9FLAO|nr:hypothetical protein SAMN06296241_2653 [Salinimicrobium sediminis]
MFPFILSIFFTEFYTFTRDLVVIVFSTGFPMLFKNKSLKRSLYAA